MLDKFKKFLTAVEKEVTMTQENTQTPELSADLTAQLADVVAQLAEHETALSAANDQVAELSAKLGDALAKLAAADAAQAALEATLKADKQASRKLAVVTAIGEAQADAVMAATEGLDDAAFTTVLSAFAASHEVEKKSPLFNEVGAAPAAEVPDVEEKSYEQKALEEKYRAQA